MTSHNAPSAQHYYIIANNGSVETVRSSGFPYKTVGNHYKQWIDYKHCKYTRDILDHTTTILVYSVENIEQRLLGYNKKASALFGRPMYGWVILQFMEQNTPSAVPLHLWTWLFCTKPEDHFLAVLKTKDIYKPYKEIRQRCLKQQELFVDSQPREA